MNRLAYRTLTADHAAPWRDLRIEGARDFPAGFIMSLEETMAADIDRCRIMLANGDIRGVLDENTLVGFCGYRPGRLTRVRHRGQIGPFFVTRAYQGTDAANAMMRGVIGEARAGGLAQLELFVDVENPRAIAFYERHGFERAATHHDSLRIDGQPRDDHFYVLRL